MIRGGIAEAERWWHRPGYHHVPGSLRAEMYLCVTVGIVTDPCRFGKEFWDKQMRKREKERDIRA